MRNRAKRYTIIFAIVGTILSAFITYVVINTTRVYDQSLLYSNLEGYVKNHTEVARQSFQQITKGEKGKDLDRDVIEPLIHTKTILEAAFVGGETELGEFPKVSDEETLVLIKECILPIGQAVELTGEKGKSIFKIVNQDSTNSVSVTDDASQLTLKLGESFQSFQRSFDNLNIHLKTKLEKERAWIKSISSVSIIILVSAFGGLGYVFYGLQFKSQQKEANDSLQLEEQKKSVGSVSTFIEAISAGNYGIDVHIEGNESLSNTLISMRDKLRNNAEEDRKRNWSNLGLAQIGELLRATTGTSQDLYDSIIKFVVKYTKSSQGGMFILNEDNENGKYLELIACYAFERKKYLKKNMQVGEGLVGQCFLEGEPIYLMEVPEEYVSITSGLGGSNPNALLIVPLKINDKIYGVLELATFGKYQDFEISLVEKLAETIASAISTVRINDSTRTLLERTQQQAEEMRAQEEEMRQNMEELEATQEEMRRKEMHIQSMLDAEKERNAFNQKSHLEIMHLSKDKDVIAGNWEKSVETIILSISKHLKVSRASVWLFNEKKLSLTCSKLYDADSRTFKEGDEISESKFPGYVKALQHEEIINVKDVSIDEVLEQYATEVLKPLHIESVLSVPFITDGKFAGIISCEQAYIQKEWTIDHVDFLKSVSELLTVIRNTAKTNKTVESLSYAKDTMQAIIDNLPRAVFWKDKDLKFQGCNIIFANIAGLQSPRDLRGLTDFDMPWKDHAEAYRADDLAVMNSKQARLDHEERNVNSFGEESWVLTSKVPVTNRQGEVIAVLGMFEDITHRKRSEAEMQNKLNELEQLRGLLGRQ